MRLPGFATRNLQLKAVATILATVTWAGVVYASNPPDTRSVTVKVPQDSAAVAPFVLVHAISDLVVQVSGTRQHLDAFVPSDIVVTANYRAIATVGTQQVPISVVNNDRDVSLGTPPSSVTATVDRLGSRDVPVTVLLTEPPPQGYVVTATATNPSTVSVFGPQQQLSSVQARVTVNLSSHKTNLAADEKVTLVDASGQPLTVFGFLVAGRPQSTVQVNISVAATVTSRTSAVLPPHTGVPAPGSEVVAITVSPLSVVLTGPEDLLNTLDVVPTQPISLSGINSTRTYTVTLLPPPGVSSATTTVTVVVTVASISVPTANPAPSATPVPTPAPSPT